MITVLWILTPLALIVGGLMNLADADSRRTKPRRLAALAWFAIAAILGGLLWFELAHRDPTIEDRAQRDREQRDAMVAASAEYQDALKERRAS